MIDKFVALVIALVLFLTAAAVVFYDPSYTVRLELAPDACAPDAWIKPAVIGVALLCIGLVAMAGARRDE